MHLVGKMKDSIYRKALLWISDESILALSIASTQFAIFHHGGVAFFPKLYLRRDGSNSNGLNRDRLFFLKLVPRMTQKGCACYSR